MGHLADPTPRGLAIVPVVGQGSIRQGSILGCCACRAPLRCCIARCFLVRILFRLVPRAGFVVVVVEKAFGTWEVVVVALLGTSFGFGVVAAVKFGLRWSVVGQLR